MNPRTLTARAAVVIATLFTASFTHAAAITWGLATNISGDSDVNTTGTLVGAVNFGPVGVSSTTINGVNFSPAGSSSGVTTTTSQALSPAYLTLLNSALLLPADNVVTVTFAGLLTVGQNYLLQTWVNNSGRTFFSRGDYPTNVSDGLGNDVGLYPGDNGIGLGAGGSNLPPAPGQYVIGTFTADSDSQSVSFFSGEINGVLNGIQLRQIPVTSTVPDGGTTLGLLVFAFASLALVSRKGGRAAAASC